VGGKSDPEILQELIDRIDDPEHQSPVLSAAGVFGEAAKSLPQLSGYTHRTLRQTGGAKLM
jgi:hypothetical protein